jgi:hypothetical protein
MKMAMKAIALESGWRRRGRTAHAEGCEHAT